MNLEINRAREPHPALGPIPQQTQDTPGRLPSDSASSLPRDMFGIWRIKRLSPRKIRPAHLPSGGDSGQLGDTHSHLGQITPKGTHTHIWQVFCGLEVHTV